MADKKKATTKDNRLAGYVLDRGGVLTVKMGGIMTG
jgi:hypothetical protein